MQLLILSSNLAIFAFPGSSTLLILVLDTLGTYKGSSDDDCNRYLKIQPYSRADMDERGDARSTVSYPWVRDRGVTMIILSRSCIQQIAVSIRTRTPADAFETPHLL
ncbi:hypothetical protein Hypma_008320 [Hypsizygus marmoreus]|uniref:Uncharacterized protein n=1 Tax=Hypsizygus marmoreus TaxID=39966 RepID=A0A369JQL4_HYPMA|nr:hypothetical protein Hypma_008320 [Hypsizygus marmoreus]